MKKLFPEIAVVCALLMVAGYGFAQTWTMTNTPFFPFVFVAESADGKKILAIGSGAYLSTNSGVNWSYAFDSSSRCAAINADGTRMIAGIITNYTGMLINISTNAGATWTPTALPNTNWNACASSADGRVLAAAVGSNDSSPGGNLYTSTNFGTSWRTNNLVKNWRALASSADGAKLAAAAANDYVYLSTNSGLTWQPNGATGSWRSVCSSIDGMHLAATGDSGTVVSTNGGSTWTPIKTGPMGFFNMNGSSVASSADGSRLVLDDNGSSISISTNYGFSWNTTNISEQLFTSTSSSADGERLFVGDEFNGGVWIWQANPSPNLSLISRSNNVTLSWLIPATNLMVQQRTDLTAGSWVALTNFPALNYTNLQNQITMPSTNGSFFYRLASP